MIAAALRKTFQSASPIVQDKVPDGLVQLRSPGTNWFKWARDNTLHTPDRAILDQYKFQLVFVYGDTMMGLPNQGRMGDGSIRLAHDAWTKDNFQVYLKRLGRESFPVALPTAEGDELKETFSDDGWCRTVLRGPACIRGELYKVRPQQFPELDKHYQNTVLFERCRVRVLVRGDLVTLAVKEFEIDEDARKVSLSKRYHDAHRLHEIKAWAYIGKPYWKELVASDFFGRSPPSYLMPPLNIYRPKNVLHRPYYRFNATHLNV